MKSRRLSTKEKLVALLEKEGFRVDYITGVEGYWRKADVVRWNGCGWRFMPELDKEIRVSFSCWYTMTECVKFGIDWDTTGIYSMYEVFPDYPGEGNQQQNAQS